MKPFLEKTAVEPFVARYPREISVETVRRFLASGPLQLDPADRIAYDGGAMWGNAVPRSLGRKTHGWFFLRYWYSAWPELDSESRRKLVSLMPQMLEKWKANIVDSSMAYHDETTAQRVINFLAWLDACNEYIPDQLKNDIWNLVGDEVDLLATDDFYAGVNNHGMFQDIAILVAHAYGVCSERLDYVEKAIKRLEAYFEDCFTVDGIHTENSPSYHTLVSRYLSMVEDYLEKTNRVGEVRDFKRLLEGADEYAAFALAPDGRFVPISDTNRSRISPRSAEDTYGRGAFLGAVTNGADGSLPARKTFVSERGGYGIYRSDWTASAAYVFFSAAYNADYHKHSDELSIYYYANGMELISESGPNGYQYEDPLTKYAYSSAAHNTLLVNGLGLPRIDKHSDSTSLVDLGTNDEALIVRGETERYAGVKWARTVSIPESSQGAQVGVVDEVESGEENLLTFLWHMGAEITPVVRGNAIELFDPQNRKVGELLWDTPSVSVRVVRGQRHPYVQGWRFPKMRDPKPAYVVEVAFRASALMVHWDLRCDDFQLRDRGVTPASAWKTFQAEKPVNYLLEKGPAPSGPAKLAIVFSAISEKLDFTFNYRKSMAKFDGDVLYILDDFGDQGAYYSSSDRTSAEFRSVSGLIEKVIQETGVSKANVVALGSSKGGTGALIHGVSSGLGRVIVGGPQYRVGDFLKDPHPNVLRYIAGGTGRSDIAWANGLVYRYLMSGQRSTRITCLVGERDGHYRRHVIPLIDDLRMLGYRPDHLVLPGTSHNELGAVFRKFVESFAESKGEADYVLPNAVSYDARDKELGIVVSLPAGATAWGQLFRNKEKIGKLISLNGGQARWKGIETSGHYRVRVYVDTCGDGDRKAFGSHSARV